MNQSDKQVIQETITHLREEVKEMERSAWLYETVNEQARPSEQVPDPGSPPAELTLAAHPSAGHQCVSSVHTSARER